jgi:hypothetical protein
MATFRKALPSMPVTGLAALKMTGIRIAVPKIAYPNLSVPRIAVPGMAVPGWVWCPWKVVSGWLFFWDGATQDSCLQGKRLWDDRPICYMAVEFMVYLSNPWGGCPIHGTAVQSVGFLSMAMSNPSDDCPINGIAVQSKAWLSNPWDGCPVQGMAVQSMWWLSSPCDGCPGR